MLTPISWILQKITESRLNVLVRSSAEAYGLVLALGFAVIAGMLGFNLVFGAFLVGMIFGQFRGAQYPTGSHIVLALSPEHPTSIS